ncbi:MAG: HPr family phosphocarrier protein [Lachnospiraceae bacterium]
MKTFDYTIKDSVGIHARPAGLIVNKAKEFDSTFMMKKGDRSADLKKLMSLMSLGVRSGETVTITVEGSDEDVAAPAMEKFLTETV